MLRNCRDLFFSEYSIQGVGGPWTTLDDRFIATVSSRHIQMNAFCRAVSN